MRKRDTYEFLLHSFVEWLQVRGYTEATRKSYKTYLAKFIRYLTDEQIEAVDQITPRDVFNYQSALYYAQSPSGKPLAVLTQHNALVVVKAFFGFLIEMEKIESDPSSSLRLPKKPQTLPDTMTLAEVEKLLEQPDTSTVLGFRNRTIMEVLYATGIRNHELCNLTIYDLNQDELRILGKGGKERIVPLGEIAANYLQEYVKSYRPKLRKNESFLFLSRTGKKINITDLTMMIRHYVQKAGILKRITPHTFRHTCATHMLQGGADIRYIQILLGHGSITSTQIYTHVDVSDLKEAHKKFHPREKANV